MSATIYDDVAEFAETLGDGPLVALDHGTKTIGIAVSDHLRTVASALKTIRKTKFSRDIEALQSAIIDRNPVGIVIGLPLNMDGSEGPRVQSARAFARNVANHVTIPITFWDERLSTVAAERALIEADTSRKRRAKVVDQVAAAYILQGALDRMSHLKGLHHDR